MQQTDLNVSMYCCLPGESFLAQKVGQNENRFEKHGLCVELHSLMCQTVLSGKYFQVQVWFTSNGDGLVIGMKDAGTRQ